MTGACPCTCIIRGEAVEDRLRAHMEAKHADNARRDDAGQIIIRRAATMYDAWLVVNEGLPVLVEGPEP
jgi:hypothetical protein